jgi:1-acyl-sn-glycerol-3-phosphate acyltransferase
MKKYDAIAPLAQCPDRTPVVVDGLLPLFGLLMGVTVGGWVWGTSFAGLPRVPMLFGGCFFGLLAPRLYAHRYRVLGFVPYLALVGAVLSAIGINLEETPNWLIGLFAFTQSAAVGCLLRYRERIRAGRVRHYGMAIVGLVVCVAVVLAFAGPGDVSDEWRAAYLLAIPVVTGVIAVIGWLTLARPAIELAIEAGMRVMYDCRVVGPGVLTLPRDGPVLVMANHAAWFDPLFIAEALPRVTTPMMTSGFYDLPILRFLMRHVFRVIRVSEASARREAPEVQEAIAALDLGRVVVIFPEGYLRRKEDEPLRRFGRGVHQILAARPDTPVVAAWIEGTWGSYFSHFNGPPTKNKRFDFRHKVCVSLADPVTIPPEVLQNHLVTRIHLMNLVAAARLHQGLPSLPLATLPTMTTEDDATGTP